MCLCARRIYFKQMLRAACSLTHPIAFFPSSSTHSGTSVDSNVIIFFPLSVCVATFLGVGNNNKEEDHLMVPFHTWRIFGVSWRTCTCFEFLMGNTSVFLRLKLELSETVNYFQPRLLQHFFKFPNFFFSGLRKGITDQCEGKISGMERNVINFF